MTHDPVHSDRPDEARPQVRQLPGVCGSYIPERLSRYAPGLIDGMWSSADNLTGVSIRKKRRLGHRT